MEDKSVHSSWHSWHTQCLKKAKRRHRPEKDSNGQINGRPTTQMVDTPSISADRPNIWSVGKSKGRWLHATAGGFQGWLTSLFPPSEAQNTSPWCKTKHRTGKLRDPEAKCAAEASGNSKRTQTWMIIERSNGDVQVLRTVKNGVSTVAPL